MILGLGFNKTGTKTAATLVSEMGGVSGHGIQWVNDVLAGRKLEPRDAYFDGQVDAAGLLVKIRDHYPDAQIVLTVRALRPWMISRYSHILTGLKGKNDDRKLACKSISKWPGRRDEHHRKVMEMFYDRVSIVDVSNKEDTIRTFARLLGLPDLGLIAYEQVYPHKNPIADVAKQKGVDIPDRKMVEKRVDEALKTVGIRGRARFNKLFL